MTRTPVSGGQATQSPNDSALGPGVNSTQIPVTQDSSDDSASKHQNDGTNTSDGEDVSNNNDTNDASDANDEATGHPDDPNLVNGTSNKDRTAREEPDNGDEASHQDRTAQEETVNGDEAYEPVPDLRWRAHLETNPDDIKYLTEPSIPLVKQFGCEHMIPEHCDFVLQDKENGSDLAEDVKTAEELMVEAQIFGPQLFGEDCMDAVFMYLCVFVLKSVLSNLHPALVFLTIFSTYQLENRVKSFIPNFLAFMTLTFAVGAFNTTFHVPTVKMLLEKEEGTLGKPGSKKRKNKSTLTLGTMKDRAEYFLKFLEEYCKVIRFGNDQEFVFDREAIIEKNVLGWRSEIVKKPKAGLYSNRGLKEKVDAADSIGSSNYPSISGVYVGWAYPMDRITEMFEGMPKSTSSLVSLYDQIEIDNWYKDRHSRRLYVPKKKTKATTLEPLDTTSVVPKTRVVLSALAFSEGFLTDEVKAFLAQYAPRRENWNSDPGDLKTVLDKLVMSDPDCDIFEEIMKTEYFALACVCCHEKKALKKVVALGENFITALEASTKRIMGLAQRKPAASA